MFAHRQPREVYRVYGEEEFFADDQQPPGEEPQAPAATTARSPSEELRAHESAHHAPAVFEEYDTVARGTPIVQDAPRLSEPWASAEVPVSDPREDLYQSPPPFSPLIATRTGSSRRTLAVALLAAAVGLLVGLIAVNSLRPADTRSVQQPPPSQAHKQLVAAPPTATAGRPHAPRARARAVSRPRPSPEPVLRAPRRAPAPSASVPAADRAPAGPEAPRISQAPQSPPEIPDSAPAPTHAPPPSSGGMEFGFEH
jgi:hypothetical protein